MENCRRIIPWIALLSVVATIAALPPQASAADPRVMRALNEAGLKYEVDDDGDYRVVMSWSEDNRSHLVFVNSLTEIMGGTEIREVWAVAYMSGEPSISGKLALRLLEDNARYKLGAWETGSNANGVRVHFNAKIPADASPALLQEVIGAVSATADELEKELLGTDEL
jgi:hypothetical protein